MPSPSLPSSLSTLFDFHWKQHPKVYIAPYISTSASSGISGASPQPAFPIDGNIEKPEWSNVPWSSYFDDIRGPLIPSNYDSSCSDNDDQSDINQQQDIPSDYSCKTKIRMMWDDSYLYIAAMMESNSHNNNGVVKLPPRATFTKRNSPIFQRDSDIEVFIDPFHTHHNYKEVELNPLNTVWNLLLDKPYSDGGCEYSAREGVASKETDEYYYETQYQHTAVKILHGQVLDIPWSSTEDKSSHGTQSSHSDSRVVWTAEIALAHSDTLVLKKDKNNCSSSMSSSAPKEGDLWRINFSRVEKGGHINWTWQPQRVWDAKMKKNVGKVNMHLPDAWGFVRFGPRFLCQSNKEKQNVHESKESTVGDSNQPEVGEVLSSQILQQKSLGDELWPHKVALMNIYYAQRRFKEIHGHFCSNMTTLQELHYTDPDILDPFLKLQKEHLDNEGHYSSLNNFQETKQVFSLETTEDSEAYLFTITDPFKRIRLSITNERYIDKESI